jgi:peptidoglycan hydrolase-like protein with peptidoglycan-binding domain
MTTIAYDQPVKDLIAQLDATYHVTHTAYRKTSVTLHHNGGRLSHEGVLDVWRTREASAHFDSDLSGAIAQFVRVNEYAWAVGDTEGNMSSISIEMADSTLAPSWIVADATWKSAARLAGWLFARVIGARPSSSNFFVHSHWSSTDCAGPYIRSIWNSIMATTQVAYDFFTGSHPVPPVNPPVIKAPAFPLPPGWYFGPRTGPSDCISGYYSYKGALAPWQARMADRGWAITVDGLFGDETANIAHRFQVEKGLVPDSLVGVRTWNAAWTSPVT